MNNLYALLVGINKYDPPNTPLYGCIKDVNKVEKYINQYHADQFNLHVKKLLDGDATYANIIDGFQNHLRNAGEEDMVWFHFSGHGSEEKSATEFLSLEPNGKDQTLWCCDSGVGGVYNLADKELAVLLYQLATTYPDGSEKASAPHIMVSLDCCHSGSGTRDAGEPDMIRTRNARASGRDRPIDSYIQGYYGKQGNNIQVPSCPHVVLSACQTYQRAGDLNNGGAFTSGLVTALKSSGGQINYADLFIRTRASVKHIRDNQTPDFSSIENFNPYTRFLAGEEYGDPQHYEVFMEKNKWYIRCGAIHGLPTDNKKPIEVEIRSFPQNKVLGTALLKTIGAQRSALDIDFSFSLKSTMKEILPGEDHYRGVIMSFPAPPVWVYVHGDQDHTTGLKNEWPKNSHIKSLDDKNDDASIEIYSEKNQFTLTDLKTNTIVQEIRLSDGDDIDLKEVYESIFLSLSKMSKWYSFLHLENKNKASKIGDWAELQLQVFDTAGNITTHTGNHVKLYASPGNSRGGQFGFMPKVKINKTTQDLFFYLMYMQPNFAIDCPDGEVIFYASEHENISELEQALWKEIRGFGPGEDEASLTSHFKLLVTTEKLDYFQFLQSKLGNFRSALSTWQPDKISDDWTTINMAITICRQEKSLDATEAVRLNDKIELAGSSSIQADVVLAPVEVSTHEVAAQDNAALLAHEGFDLVDLRADTKVTGPQLLELQNVRHGGAEELEKNPLQVNIDQTCEDNEMIVPLVYDGTYFRVAGDSESDEKGSSVSIDRLPTLVDAGKDSAEYMGERGVFSSMKLAFFKLVLDDKKTNTLSALDLDNDELVLTTSGMAQRVMTSKSFLLVLHGIMGDGLSLCKDIGARNPEFLKKYDCVLAYDYECLNTPMEETAAQLKKDLKNLNLDSHENKTIDIVAHSCGGLVGRWLVEQEGGNSFVQNLTMIATPNAGSLFGKVEEYRSFALNILEVAANFMPHIIPGSGLLIKVLKFAGNLTPALGQMSADSEFLTQLNTSPDPKTQYVIVSGDARDVDSNHASQMVKRLYRNSTRSGNDAEVHDLFATTKSVELQPIFNLREIKPEYRSSIKAHHFGIVSQLELE